MNGQSSAAGMLPLPLPRRRQERAALVILRRMAAHGLHDSAAVMLALDTFGTGFRRMLVLLRAFMLELARASRRSIRLAPCCAMRMTGDEGLMMAALAQAGDDPGAAGCALMQLAGDPGIGEALSIARILGKAIGSPAGGA